MKTDDETAAALAHLWKECKRKMGAKASSAWTAEGLKGRLGGIEDCAHAAGIWARFQAATTGKPVKDLPGQRFFSEVPGFGADKKNSDESRSGT